MKQGDDIGIIGSPLLPMVQVTLKVTAEEIRTAWRSRADDIDEKIKSKRLKEDAKAYADSFRFMADHIEEQDGGYIMTIDELVAIGVIEPIRFFVRAGRFGGCGCG